MAERVEIGGGGITLSMAALRTIVEATWNAAIRVRDGRESAKMGAEYGAIVAGTTGGKTPSLSDEPSRTFPANEGEADGK